MNLTMQIRKTMKGVNLLELLIVVVTVGILAAITGVGGGFIMVPAMIFMAASREPAFRSSILVSAISFS